MDPCPLLMNGKVILLNNVHFSILLIFLCMILGCGKSINTDISKQNGNLNGNIEAIKTTNYSYNDQNVKTANAITYAWYDENSNILKEKIINLDGVQTYLSTYKYNLFGNLIENVQLVNGISQTTYLFKYDDRNKIIEESKTYISFMSDIDFLDYVRIYEYDEFGNNTRINEFDENKLLYNITKNKFNKKGKLIQSTLYLKSGDISYDEYMEYNRKGTLLNIIEYYYFGNNTSKTIYKYDEFGNWIFTDNGQGLVSRIEYLYDDKNNWITQTQYNNEVISFSEEREIEYADYNFANNDYKNNVTLNGGKTKIKMVEKGGVYEINCQINSIPMIFIFDTGASNISISETEATFLYKQGKLSKIDIIGKSNFIDATGNISTGTIINLRNVGLGEIDLKNVEATVVHNMEAPLLMGQSALERFGKISIDYKLGEITLEH